MISIKKPKKSKNEQFHSILNSTQIVKNIEKTVKTKTEPKVSVHEKISFLEYLISMKCNVNSVDVNGQTPMHSACIANDIDAVEFLYKNGGNLSIADKNDMQPYNVTDDPGIKNFIVLNQNAVQCRL